MPSPRTNSLGLLLALWLAAAQAEVTMVIQASPLAGSQYYGLVDALPRIRVGDALTLVAEPGNRHDGQAIRVEWQGIKLGYVPRRDNGALAAAMARGEPVRARVIRLADHPDPWRRLEFEVYVPL